MSLRLFSPHDCGVEQSASINLGEPKERQSKPPKVAAGALF
jgi:hypothetical protein